VKPSFEKHEASPKPCKQGVLANLDLQNTILALGDVVALAETMQLHLGLPGGHVIRGADEVSVHVEEHNVS
jgi:hypothetical protein